MAEAGTSPSAAKTKAPRLLLDILADVMVAITSIDSTAVRPWRRVRSR
jgi:hypothetical protein